MRIGAMLLDQGAISFPQLTEALSVQKQQPQRPLGEILLALEYVDAGEFARILREQIRQPGE